MPANLKAIFARVLQWLGIVDSRLTKSAGAGIVISIFTALLIGAITGVFKSDDKLESGPNISRVLYETKVTQQACSEDKFSVLLNTANTRILAMLDTGLTVKTKAEILVIWADLVRATRPIALAMAKDFEGITPPRQYASDHEEMMGAIQVYLKVIDDLDRALPAELSRSPQTLLSDPKLDDRLADAGNAWKGASVALKGTNYSPAFASAHTCPAATALPTPAVSLAYTPGPLITSPTLLPATPGATPTPFSLLPNPTLAPFVFPFTPVATSTFRPLLSTPSAPLLFPTTPSP